VRPPDGGRTQGGSIAVRLVITCGALSMASMLAVSAVFYFGLVHMIDADTDAKIQAQSSRMATRIATGSPQQIADEIGEALANGIDSENDGELYLVQDSAGRTLGGNIAGWDGIRPARAVLLTRSVQRRGEPIRARLMVHALPGDGVLAFGYEAEERDSIRPLMIDALIQGALLALALAVAGALLFRRLIERRIGDVRRAAVDVAAGDMRRRIAVTGDHEFDLLNADINRMLDRIEHLMDGIRNVSNAIAHDLRTPLMRVRSRLDEALRQPSDAGLLADAAAVAIGGIDDLIGLFERLLQIAQAESGLRADQRVTVDLQRIAADMVDMHDAAAELHGVSLRCADGAPVALQADRNLVATALASLIDNAIKHAGSGAVVTVSSAIEGEDAVITVRDNGPGVPPDQRARVVERFYRLDQSRAVPGNGLGLSIVQAIATAHGGQLCLGDAGPGLLAQLRLPRRLPPQATGANRAR
jgi:signal transduction histidine kinase